MKKITAFFIVLFISVTVIQGQDINNVFEKYTSNERFEYVSVGSLLIKFAKKFIPNEYGNLISKVNSLKILTLSQADENRNLYIGFQNDINKLTSDKTFEIMVTSRSKSDDTVIYKRVSNTDDADVLMVIKNDNDLNLIWFSLKATKEELNEIFQEEESDE